MPDTPTHGDEIMQTTEHHHRKPLAWAVLDTLPEHQRKLRQHLGERMKREREQAGLSIHELARRAAPGVAASQISEMERGIRWHPAASERVAKVLDALAPVEEGHSGHAGGSDAE